MSEEKLGEEEENLKKKMKRNVKTHVEMEPPIGVNEDRYMSDYGRSISCVCMYV